jgi:hypothetical protein
MYLDVSRRYTTGSTIIGTCYQYLIVHVPTLACCGPRNSTWALLVQDAQGSYDWAASAEECILPSNACTRVSGATSASLEGAKRMSCTF